MNRGFYQGVRFEYEFRKWTVCNWDDTDQLWLCRDSHGNFRYFTNDKIEKILFKKIQNYLDNTIQM